MTSRLTPGAVHAARPVADVPGQLGLFAEDVPPVVPASAVDRQEHEHLPVYRAVEQLAPRLADVVGSGAFRQEHADDPAYERIRRDWHRIAKRLVTRYTDHELTTATDDQLQRALRADSRGRKARI